jgi:hypothetical protein
MARLICFLFGHDWEEWWEVRPFGWDDGMFSATRFHLVCKRCRRYWR